MTAVASRRAALQGLGALLLAAHAPVGATPAAMQAAMRAFAGGATPREGRVRLDIPPLVENGNAVPVTVGVDAPQRVQRIALFTERNPLPDVVVFDLGPRCARPQVSTRMRLATSQRVAALALLADGSCWMQQLDVVVTLAACVEG